MSTSSLPEPNEPIFLTETQVKFHIYGSLTSAPASVTQTTYGLGLVWLSRWQMLHAIRNRPPEIRLTKFQSVF